MFRQITVLLALAIAVGTLAAGCTSKKPKVSGDVIGEDGLYQDQVIIGYDENGNPIYGMPEDAVAGRDEFAEEVGGAAYEPVYFDYDSDSVPPAESGKVAAVAECLQANPMYGLIIEGHCDERGANEYNTALGEKRALAVRSALISRGIDAGRMQTRSYGEERPVAFEHNEASWRLNRRAEFIFTK
jgi:peptidoglycan-associated lipoprotein